jgi:starch phosphorylase
MKFMLNGAVTIGTLDGANVEMLEEVGEENMFIFGMKAEEAYQLYESNAYSPWDVCNLNQSLRVVMTQFINGQLSDDRELFRELYDSLLNGSGGSRPDEYFILKDFESYSETQELLSQTYANKRKWAEMAVMNVAKSGKFSSDRTIEQYSREIWDLKKVRI